MATIQDRTFSHTYSGLKNQFAVAGVLAAACLTGYELMRRRRRGRGRSSKYEQELGSVETWEFGYLFQGRCWAQFPSPALPKYPLQWITQAISYPESNLPNLIGVDASTYIRFLQGCRRFVLLHTLTTFPIIFTIHLVFSPSNIPISSMDKASISSLVPSQQHLLYIHVIIAYWIAITWLLNLLWLTRHTLRFRAQATQALREKYSTTHTQLTTSAPPPPVNDQDDDISSANRGIRLRTVMVTNIPVPLRNEADLKEYFEYYLSRHLANPPIAFGFFTRVASVLFQRITMSSTIQRFRAIPDDAAPLQHEPKADDDDHQNATSHHDFLPLVERVVIARKMTELASLLERRDTVLKELEHAHIRLAQNVLQAVRDGLDTDNQEQEPTKEDKELFSNLSPFVKQFHVSLSSPQPVNSIVTYFKHAVQFVRKLKLQKPKEDEDISDDLMSEPLGKTSTNHVHGTIWEALHSLPPSHLDRYQPLIRLNKLFLGKSVPEIDYYNARLDYLTSLITEDKSRPIGDYQPTSTAFVTFSKIEDARRAIKFLQSHPRNPLACLVVPAPDVRDLDWARIMKSSFTGEFLKDWVIEAGVWAFTLSWIIPISLLISLVNIQNLSVVIPSLQNYFNKHPDDKEAISSLLPTIIFSLLTILIPVLLFLIGKKGHTIVTFSKLHDTIMIRYWKFLVCNLLIFFCVGVGALESFLQFFKHTVDIIPVIASSFPIAGPFYVGWLILQTAIHGFLELGLFGLPLIVYPSTKVSNTLRRRAEGIRPRTFNYYYWLPNHLLVATIVLLFSLLNPLVIPFALVYFCVESVIVKHQLLHVYARSYENNGKILLIRTIRFSLDGLILAHVVFLAFLVVLKETPEAAFIGILLVLSVFTKLGVTRICRAKFAEGDKAEEAIFANNSRLNAHPSENTQRRNSSKEVEPLSPMGQPSDETNEHTGLEPYHRANTLELGQFMTWKELPRGVQLNYASYPPRRQFNIHRPINPFQPQRQSPEKNVLPDNEGSKQPLTEESQADPVSTSSLSAPLSGQNDQQRSTNNSLIVTPHPSFPLWDDSPDLDQPYDNPFYRTPIDKVLWLPRNPFGTLDLDDTVDLHVRLTSSSNQDKLNRWLEEEEGEKGEGGSRGHGWLTDSPRMSPSTPLGGAGGDSGDSELKRPPLRAPASSGGARSSASKFRPQRQYTGMEDISMSSVLVARTNALNEKENNKMLAVARVKGNNNNNSKQKLLNSRELHNILSTESTFTTSSRSQQNPRLRSWTHDPVLEPDLHAENALLRGSFHLASPSSTAGVAEEATPVDETREVEHHDQNTGNSISLGEAVLCEVVAEEQQYAAERVQREVNEKRTWERLYRLPSWWKWFFWRSSGGYDHHLGQETASSVV